MRTRVRIESDPARVHVFLVENDYPHTWTVDFLSRCLLLRLEQADQTAGYLWLHWIAGADSVLELHVCVTSKARGRWLTPSVLADARKACELISAKAILARPPAPILMNLLVRLGFRQTGPFAVLPLE